MLSMQLECPACRWWTLAGEVELARRLRTLGLLRRSPDPPEELVRELLTSHGPRLRCDRCGAEGLAIRPGDREDRGDWHTAVVCEICREPIPPERLAIVPDARRCVGCQSAADRGASFVEPEYCPRCGSLVELRVSHAGGVARYKLFCTGSPPCRL